MRHATILDPTDAFLFFSLGQALGQNGCHAESRAACERAILIEPRQALFWPQAVIAALGVGDPARAEELVAMALILFPERADMHYIGSCVLVQQDRLAEAETAIRQAVALDPATRMFRRHLASVLVRRGRWEAAHQLLFDLEQELPGEAGVTESLAHVARHLAHRTTAPPLAGTL
jgi:Flp pilus assembly protein TadD